MLLQWAAAIESLDRGSAVSDKSFGMKQRPDGDIEIDEKFWEEDFHIPACEKCSGVLKPDVRILPIEIGSSFTNCLISSSVHKILLLKISSWHQIVASEVLLHI